MKNLKEVAATFGYYQVQDIPERYKNEDFDFSTRDKDKFIPELLLKMSNIETGVFYQCAEDTDHEGKKTYYIDSFPGSFVLVKAKNSELLLRLGMNDKKYHLHLDYAELRPFNFAHYSERKSATKDLIEPNRIGVFTEKKVNDWLTYCEAYYKCMQAMKARLDGEADENKAIIENFINWIFN